MQRLRPFDANFLYMETRNNHMQAGGLGLYDPSTTATGLSLDRVRELFAERIHLVPPLRRRLVEVPFNLYHPVWVDDPDFDLDWHIRRIGVPPPGGEAELAETVSGIMSIQLDRRRPLWEGWLIEGLADGNTALLMKSHHAAIDGVSGNEILATVLDVEPDGRDVEPAPDEWTGERIPTELELAARGAAAAVVNQPRHVARAARRSFDEVARRRREQPSEGVTPAAAPHVWFSGRITARRNFAFGDMDFERVRTVKGAADVTVNDVVLAVCGGALRRYLDQHDEHPDGSLVAMVPMSVRTADEHDEAGNLIKNMFLALGTDVADPVERLRQIHAAAGTAKDHYRDGGIDMVQEAVEAAPPIVTVNALRLAARPEVAQRIPLTQNLTISNVPGSPVPLYLAGARMVAHYPFGPIYDHAGLNMTVMSYCGRLQWGVTGCPDVTPDAADLIGHLDAALDELEGAVGLS